MPEAITRRRALKKKREGKAPSTQAGEFVREEIHHIREGKHGARSAKQAIAIGLSKARKAGVKLPAKSRKQALESRQASSNRNRKVNGTPSQRRSRAISQVVRREPRSAASHKALSRHAHLASQARTPESRHLSAEKAMKTKGKKERSLAAKKAVRTRRKAIS